MDAGTVAGLNQSLRPKGLQPLAPVLCHSYSHEVFSQLVAEVNSFVNREEESQFVLQMGSV